MRWLGLVIGLGLLSSAALAQEIKGSSTITVGAGVAGGQRNVSDVGFAGKLNYEYRISRHLAAETGLEVISVSVYRPVVAYALPSGQNISGYFSDRAFSFDKRTDHVLQIPFGLKGILPFSNDRVELFGGLGAIAVAHKVDYFGPRWLGQVSLGGRFAVDKSRRIWVGAMGRGFTNFTNLAEAGRQGYTVTAEIGFRFGR